MPDGGVIHGYSIPAGLSEDAHREVVVLLRRLRNITDAEPLADEAVRLTERIRSLTEHLDLTNREQAVAEREGAVERFRSAWEERGEVIREVPVQRQRAAPRDRRSRTGIELPPARPEDCPMGFGNLTGYAAGCRCDACVEANRTYQRAYARRRRETRAA